MTQSQGQGKRYFQDVLLTRTIRAIEEQGPLEDASELREAAQQASSREDRVVARARMLGKRIGLLQDLERIGALAKVLAPLSVLAVVLLTGVLIGTVLGEGRRINVLLAGLGVLGPNFVSLAIWLAAVLTPGSTATATLAQGLGGIALRVSSSRRWAGSHAPDLLREGIEMLRETRLLPWAFGVVNHGIWALSFVGLAGVLYVMFALRSYQLIWESTILSESAFVDFIAATGRPAEILGLPRADFHVGTSSGALTSPQLAFWLMYCVLLYGFVPRLFLGLWSWRKWMRSRDHLRLDLTAPYYRRLLQRIDRLSPPVIVDADDTPADVSGSPAVSRATKPSGPPVWIAFELPTGLAWRRDDGLAAIEVAGDSEGRHRVIDRLMREPACRAVVVCNGSSSPDRGTARFLRDVSAHVGAVALLLVAPTERAASRTALWSAWLQDCGLGRMPVFEHLASALDWQAGAGAS